MYDLQTGKVKFVSNLGARIFTHLYVTNIGNFYQTFNFCQLDKSFLSSLSCQKLFSIVSMTFSNIQIKIFFPSKRVPTLQLLFSNRVEEYISIKIRIQLKTLLFHVFISYVRNSMELSIRLLLEKVFNSFR